MGESQDWPHKNMKYKNKNIEEQATPKTYYSKYFNCKIIKNFCNFFPGSTLI